MNPTDHQTDDAGAMNASLRAPLFALLGGAAVWLVVGLGLGLVASVKFHAPEFLSACPLLTYGRVTPSANDAVLYGFCLPAALGVMLWIFARLGRMPLALPLVPVVAANLWHLGVLLGIVEILLGNSTGHTWLEFPRAAAVLLFTAFMLMAISAAATFGWRRERSLYPSHWFLFAALLWFPWIYSTANLFLLSTTPPRGVVQPVIGWWFANNLVFVWLALTGIGTAFYFLPKLAGRPLASFGYARFAFLTLIFFGTWCGIPAGAPVPSWLPTTSALAALLILVPIAAVAGIAVNTIRGAGVVCHGGPFCFIKFGVISFVLSGLLYAGSFCPPFSRMLEFTWFGVAQTQLQLLVFFAMVMFGAAYEILPRVTGRGLPFPKLVRLHFGISILGVAMFVLPLLVAGVEQGRRWSDAGVAFADVNKVALPYLRISIVGQLLIFLGALLFALNLFVMAIRWKLARFKSLVAAMKAPLPDAEGRP